MVHTITSYLSALETLVLEGGCSDVAPALCGDRDMQCSSAYGGTLARRASFWTRAPPVAFLGVH